MTHTTGAVPHLHKGLGLNQTKGTAPHLREGDGQVFGLPHVAAAVFAVRADAAAVQDHHQALRASLVRQDVLHRVVDLRISLLLKVLEIKQCSVYLRADIQVLEI